MPKFMWQKQSDRLRLRGGVPGGGNQKEWPHTDNIFQPGGGNDAKKKKNIEDNVREQVQRDLETVVLVSSLPPGDTDITDPVWPMYHEGGGPNKVLVCRTDTFDIRVLNLNPLEYTIWLGRAELYQTPPANWWE